jgi:aminobenzoyl-glutamate utilization protein B
MQWTFQGEPGHGARAWTARSALDAVEIMDVSMNFLREHLEPEVRFHYVITDGGIQPNVVPERATVWYYFRERDYDRLLTLVEKGRIAAKAAAEATGTTVNERVLSSSWPINGNKSLAELMYSNIQLVGLPQWSADDIAFAENFQKAMGAEVTGLATQVEPFRHSTQGSSSSDAGDVTWNVPYARLSFPSQIDGKLGGHHWSAGIVPATPVAHKGITAGSKVLAGSLVDLFRNPAAVAAIKQDFANDTRGLTWRSLIPAGTEPPNFLNAELMARYRAQLAQFKYDPNSRQTYLQQLGVSYPGAAPRAALGSASDADR